MFIYNRLLKNRQNHIKLKKNNEKLKQTTYEKNKKIP